jgi:hypothetical protein
MKEKLVCECGSTKFIKQNHGIIIAVYPPIHQDVYNCEKCGREHHVTTHVEKLPIHEAQEVEINVLRDTIITKL